MKNHLYSGRNWRFVSSVSIILFFMVFSELKAQDYHRLYGGGQSIIYQTGNAKILIRANSISTEPLFKVEGRNGLGNSLGTVQTLVSFDDKPYGIYQTAPTIFDASSFSNYFESRVNIGQSTFPDMLGVRGDFGLRPSANHDTIHFNVYDVGGCSPTIAYRFHDLQVTGTPLIINNCAVKAPILETVSLKITKNPGENLVLISDLEGNASWADPSRFHDDDWLISTVGKTGTEPPAEMRSIYFNNRKYKNVGIGTDSPLQKLHMVDGNILLSRRPDDNPCSLNGSILFGDLPTVQWPNGEWGIEYFHEGLNFWKVASASNAGANNCLFLKNNGNVGIATELPLDRFQVNEGTRKVVIGEGPVYVYDSKKEQKLRQGGIIEGTESINGLGYIGFNTAHNQDGWLVSGNGSQNAGTLIYNSPYGEMFFCTVPITESHNDKQFTQTEMGNYTRMTINNNGFVGIGTMGPDCSLDVRKNFNAKIECFSQDDSQASIWTGNRSTSYGFVVSDQGVCHLSSNMGSPASIMSLQPGSVGVTANLQVTGNTGVSGKVGIGAVTLSDYPNSTSKLFVEGGITTEEVHVKLKADWSDFVFNNDYKLRSLSDLEQYIKANKHLPEIPTESTVKKEGIELGKMNALLLQKVEELTLYILEQQKQIDNLTKEVRNK